MRCLPIVLLLLLTLAPRALCDGARMATAGPADVQPAQPGEHFGMTVLIVLFCVVAGMLGTALHMGRRNARRRGRRPVGSTEAGDTAQ